MQNDGSGLNPLEALMACVARIDKRNAWKNAFAVAAIVLPFNLLPFYEASIPFGILVLLGGNALWVPAAIGPAVLISSLIFAFLFLPLEDPEMQEIHRITFQSPGVVFELEELDHPEVKRFLPICRRDDWRIPAT